MIAVIPRRSLIVGGTSLFFARRVAAQAPPVHRIGVLAQDLQPGLLENFRAGLREFGYEEGKNISI